MGWQDERPWYNDRIFEAYITEEKVDKQRQKLDIDGIVDIMPWFVKYGVIHYKHTWINFGEPLAWKREGDKIKIKAGAHTNFKGRYPYYDKIWDEIKDYERRQTPHYMSIGGFPAADPEWKCDGRECWEELKKMGITEASWVGSHPANTGAQVTDVSMAKGAGTVEDVLVDLLMSGDTVQKPFGPWENWDDCMKEMRKRYDEETAQKVCGKLKARLEKQSFPGGFEGCVDHFMNDPDFKSQGGRTKRESAEALCAYIGRQTGKIKSYNDPELLKIKKEVMGKGEMGEDEEKKGEGEGEGQGQGQNMTKDEEEKKTEQKQEGPPAGDEEGGENDPLKMIMERLDAIEARLQTLEEKQGGGTPSEGGEEEKGANLGGATGKQPGELKVTFKEMLEENKGLLKTALEEVLEENKLIVKSTQKPDPQGSGQDSGSEDFLGKATEEADKASGAKEFFTA